MLLLSHPKYAFILKASIFIDHLIVKSQAMTSANNAEQKKLVENIGRILDALDEMAKQHFSEQYRLIAGNLYDFREVIQEFYELENKSGLENVCTLCGESMQEDYCLVCWLPLVEIIQNLESKQAFLTINLRD